MNSIGEFLKEQNIPAITINIPESKLTDDKLRKDYITDLFKEMGCEHHFLNATVRDDVQRDDPDHVRLIDGFDGGFRKVYRPLLRDLSESEFRRNAKQRLDTLLDKYLDPLLAKQEFTIDDDDLKTLDPDAIKKSLQEALLSKQARAACSTSHMRALQWGKEQFESGKIKAVLITEDDIQWLGDAARIEKIFRTCLKELETGKIDWDIFMLGASNYIPHERKGEPNAESIKESDALVKVRFSYGNYAYLVNGPSIDKVIGIFEKHLSTSKAQQQPIFAQDVVLSDAIGKDLTVYSSDPKIVGPLQNCYSVICDQKMPYEIFDRWVLNPKQ